MHFCSLLMTSFTLLLTPCPELEIKEQLKLRDVFVGPHLNMTSALQTLCSAVVQVYGADRSSNWVKRCCGVACLVKDNPQRSYFIRVFDIKVSHHCHRLSSPHWAPASSCCNSGLSAGGQDHVPAGALPQLLHQHLQVLLHLLCRRRKYYCSSMVVDGDGSGSSLTPLPPFPPPLSILPLQTCQVGLNFASEEEARRFRAAISDLLNRRQRKTGEEVPPSAQEPPPLLILLISGFTTDSCWFQAPIPVCRSWSNQHGSFALCPGIYLASCLSWPMVLPPSQVLSPPPKDIREAQFLSAGAKHKVKDVPLLVLWKDFEINDGVGSGFLIFLFGCLFFFLPDFLSQFQFRLTFFCFFMIIIIFLSLLGAFLN